MAAARLRQAGARIASVATASGLAGAAGYSATKWALSDTVPYGEEGGRRRGPEPLWAAVLGAARLRANPWMNPLGPATTESLAEHGFSAVAQKVRHLPTLHSA